MEKSVLTAIEQAVIGLDCQLYRSVRERSATPKLRGPPRLLSNVARHSRSSRNSIGETI
jgi:hypothetical protein